MTELTDTARAARHRAAARRGCAPCSPPQESTRCSSRSSRTSATSPASPARPRSLLVTRRRRVVRHRRPLHARSRRSSSARPASTPRIEIGLTAAAAARAARRARSRAGARLGLEEHSVTWAEQRDFAAAFAGVELVPAGDARRGPAPGEGRGRGRPHPARRARSPTTRSSRCCRASPTASPSGSSRSRSSSRCASAARAATASTRSSRPARTARSRTHMPTDRVIERNELVVCDFGCIVDGYCSDMTRTVSVGDPGPDARHLYDVVLAEPAGGPGASSPPTSRAPTSTARRATSSPTPGWADAFSHSTGPRRRSRDPRGAAGRVDRP